MPRTSRPGASVAACITVALLLAHLPAPARADDTPATARALLLTGRTTEAQAAYARLATRDRVAAAIGTARCREAVGDRDGALRALAIPPPRDSAGALLCAERARLEFARGRYAAAQALVDTALAIAPRQPEAHYLVAELHRVAGRLDEASEGYRWLVRYYNDEQDRIADPDVLRWIGLAAAQYARWNRNSGQFHFLVNTLYPDACKLDSLYWPAHLESALLFIEKFNGAAANDEIDAGLAIDPRAAALHAARALVAFQGFDFDSTSAALHRALAIDPHLPAALRLAADLDFVVSGPAAALAKLDSLRAWNPVDEETLGRLAAAYAAQDGVPDDLAGTRMGRVVDDAVARNPHCGGFFAALAASLDLRFDYPHAARFYDEARRRMPQLVTVPGQLGLVAMRLGDEDRARTVLKEAFELDPFNTRVKNSLDVLEVLAGYHTIETPHFVLRFDPARDSLLARAASRWLEDEVYPQDVKAMRFAPPGRTLVEIFNDANDTNGHAWFSIRMAGVPFVGTIGASSGGMIAITSPDATGRPYNWARVLKHEFVHVLNLQQTGYAVPRWYTEGLAVRNEGPGTPGSWDGVLARRLDAGRLFDLSTINMGFMRPRSADDWTLAYAQAELYTRFVADTHGAAALNRMLDAYAARRDTRAVIDSALGTTPERFEAGYRRYVAARVHGADTARTTPRVPAPVAADVPELERASDRQPGDATLLARLAAARFAAGRPFEARTTAQRALALDPRQAMAAVVVARVDLLTGDEAGARVALRAAFDPAAPDPELLPLLADRLLRAREFAAAESVVAIGAARFPNAADWQAGRLAIWRATGRTDSLPSALARAAERDPDDFGVRLELATLAIAAHDFAAAERWSTEALQVRIGSAEAHAARAAALAGRGRPREAAEEYGTAIALAPDHPEWSRARDALKR